MEIFLDIILPIIIGVFVIAMAVIIYITLKKKTKVSEDMLTKTMPKTLNVALNEHYVQENEMQFLANLTRALPSELIAFPNVGVDRLVYPTKDKLLYNAIGREYVDICVFLRRGMKPVLVVDLYEEGGVSEKLKVMDENVVKALNTAHIPVMKCAINTNISGDELKMKVIQSLNGEIVALLKSNVTNKN